MSDVIVLRRPDDWHVHLRDGAFLNTTVAHTARQFGRAIVMPNLVEPVVNVEQALAYRTRIMAACPKEFSFEPLMTLYLTEQTSVEDIVQAKKSGVVAVKWYPAGSTTHSSHGVGDIAKVVDVLEKMAECDLPLLIHGEVVDGAVDIFDREAVFIESILAPLVERFSDLRIVLEHITTKDAVQFVQSVDKHLGATITPQHLLFNRNQLLVGGVKPHYYCLPVLKRSVHQEALVEAVISGDKRFFLGTDSAPHEVQRKESSCGCAGCYSAYDALALYAMVFEQAGALDKLENFASVFGAAFYGCELNNGSIKLVRDAWKVPECLDFGDGKVVPLMAGETLGWRFVDD